MSTKMTAIQTIVSGLALTLGFSVPGVLADTADSVQGSNAPAGKAQSSNAQLSSAQSPSTDSAQTHAEKKEITLTDLYEVGLALERIKQQSINVYVEATRNSVGPDAPVAIVDPSSIPVNHKSTKYLPPRRDWLVFYMSTMEPIIHLLAVDVQDTQSGVRDIVIPESLKTKIDPIWQSWTAKVADLNNRLTKLLELIDDAPKNNVPIAQEAIGIFEDVKQLESLRREVYIAIQHSQSKTAQLAN
jgi:hypothetical protein